MAVDVRRRPPRLEDVVKNSELWPCRSTRRSWPSSNRRVHLRPLIHESEPVDAELHVGYAIDRLVGIQRNLFGIDCKKVVVDTRSGKKWTSQS